MTAPLDIYPLSTGDGKSIPLDVVAPTSFLLLSFTNVATAAIALPDTTDLISISATEDCYVRFANAAAEVPVSGVLEDNLFFVDKRMQTILYPQQKYISVIGLATSGQVRLQFLDAWHALALASQYLRR